MSPLAGARCARALAHHEGRRHGRSAEGHDSGVARVARAVDVFALEKNRREGLGSLSILAPTAPFSDLSAGQSFRLGRPNFDYGKEAVISLPKTGAERRPYPLDCKL